MTAIRRVLCVARESDRREGALVEHASALTRSHQAELTLLSDAAGAGLEEALAFTSPATHVIKGDPREVVPALARDLDVDLTVMGTMARTGIAGFFMGNTAEAIIDQLHCSLLALKPEGYVTPIDA